MTNRINDLTYVMGDNSSSGELTCGKVALENKAYGQAWEHLMNAYNLKIKEYKSKRVGIKDVEDIELGEIAYCMARVIGENKNSNSQLIQNIISEDKDVSRSGYTGEKARKYVGRKYLKFAADNGYPYAIIDYVYNCMGYNPGKYNFNFEFREENSKIALYWVENVMQRSKNKEVRAQGYCIAAIYYWDSYKETQDTNLIGSFIDNITKSRKEYDWEDYPSRKEYVLYTEGCLYLSPEVRKRAEGKYFDPQKSYELFTEIVNIDDYDVDDNILKNAKENKEKLETKFSGFLKKKI